MRNRNLRRMKHAVYNFIDALIVGSDSSGRMTGFHGKSAARKKHLMPRHEVLFKFGGP